LQSVLWAGLARRQAETGPPAGKKKVGVKKAPPKRVTRGTIQPAPPPTTDEQEPVGVNFVDLPAGDQLYVVQQGARLLQENDGMPGISGVDNERALVDAGYDPSRVRLAAALAESVFPSDSALRATEAASRLKDAQPEFFGAPRLDIQDARRAQLLQVLHSASTVFNFSPADKACVALASLLNPYDGLVLKAIDNAEAAAPLLAGLAKDTAASLRIRKAEVEQGLDALKLSATRTYGESAGETFQWAAASDRFLLMTHCEAVRTSADLAAVKMLYAKTEVDGAEPDPGRPWPPVSSERTYKGQRVLLVTDRRQTANGAGLITDKVRETYLSAAFREKIGRMFAILSEFLLRSSVGFSPAFSRIAQLMQAKDAQGVPMVVNARLQICGDELPMRNASMSQIVARTALREIGALLANPAPRRGQMLPPGSEVDKFNAMPVPPGPAPQETHIEYTIAFIKAVIEASEFSDERSGFSWFGTSYAALITMRALIGSLGTEVSPASAALLNVGATTVAPPYQPELANEIAIVLNGPEQQENAMAMQRAEDLAEEAQDNGAGVSLPGGGGAPGGGGGGAPGGGGGEDDGIQFCWHDNQLKNASQLPQARDGYEWKCGADKIWREVQVAAYWQGLSQGQGATIAILQDANQQVANIATAAAAAPRPSSNGGRAMTARGWVVGGVGLTGLVAAARHFWGLVAGVAGEASILDEVRVFLGIRTTAQIQWAKFSTFVNSLVPDVVRTAVVAAPGAIGTALRAVANSVCGMLAVAVDPWFAREVFLVLTGNAAVAYPALAAAAGWFVLGITVYLGARVVYFGSRRIIKRLRGNNDGEDDIEAGRARRAARLGAQPPVQLHYEIRL
jgi:hypothetical protein